jgi:hypothetical protein
LAVVNNVLSYLGLEMAEVLYFCLLYLPVGCVCVLATCLPSVLSTFVLFNFKVLINYPFLSSSVVDVFTPSLVIIKE